jgi:hypothetical protein
MEGSIELPIQPERTTPIRKGSLNRLPWVEATGSPALLSDKATFYVMKVFDYESARKFDEPLMILAKVVCNLRNYFRQGETATVRLVSDYFNPKSDYAWSPEGIRLVWELVEGFSPSLGLADETAQAMHRAAFLQREVIYLLSHVQPGGRVSNRELMGTFTAWNPELEVTSNAFTRAVQAVTGLTKLRSNGIDYWVGFHLPMAEVAESPGSKAA